MGQMDRQEELTFGPKGRAYFLEVSVATILATLLVLLVCAIVWMVYDGSHDAYPSGVAETVCGGIVVGVLWGGWCIVRGPARSTIVVAQTELKFGLGPFTKSYALPDVTFLRLEQFQQDAAEPVGTLEIEVRGRVHAIILGGKELACADILHSRCPNALYVDAEGTVHAPADKAALLETTDRIVRRRKREAWQLLFAGAGIALGAASMCATYVVLLRWGEKPPVATLLVFGPLVLVGIGLSGAGVSDIRRTRRLAERTYARIHGMIEGTSG